MVATRKLVRNRKRDIESKAVRRAFGQMVTNFLFSRSRTADSMRGGFGIDPPGRDLDYECGYPCEPDLQTYCRLYAREGYAKRVVDVWPDECWAVRPELYETEDSRVTKFERAWVKLNRKLNVWHYLHRVDRLSGKGEFGVLLMGFDDGRTLDRPVKGVNLLGKRLKSGEKSGKSLNLIYLQTFSEENVRIAEIERDRGNPRYGQPKFYEVITTTPTSQNAKVQETLRVHWTRIIHVADNRDENDVFGVPRMRPVLNRLLDIRKTLGGSAEMFWKGAFPGYSFETVPELLGESVMDEDSIREQFDEYQEGLKRYLALDGAKVNQLFPQVADPTAHVVQQVTAICATMAIPLRIFLGSESGHLASTQDLGTWNKRVAERQMLYVEPMLVRPFVDRMIALGVLPEPTDGEYLIAWRDLNTMSDRDKADVSLKRAQALMQYVSGGVEAVMPPRQFFTMVLGLSELEADSLMAAVEKGPKQFTDPLGDKAAVRDAKLNKVQNPAGAGVRSKTQGGGRTGNPGKATGGRPAGRVQRNRLRRALVKL